VPRPAISLKKLGGRRKAKDKPVVGLEIEPSHIAAAEVDLSHGIEACRAAVSMLRPGILRDGEVTDAEALTADLTTFFAEHELGTRVRLGIANQRIVVRTLDLPPLEDPKQLAAAVAIQAPDHIPMPMDDAVVDFQSLGIVETPTGPKSRVVVVAVRREMVAKMVGVAQDAGLTVVGVDLSAFAMLRALDVDTAEDGAVLYVSAGGLTNVAVASGADCLFTRTAAGGLEGIAGTLAERASLTMEHARMWLGHVGLEQPLEDVEGDAELVASARATLADGVHQLADTVRNSVNFYRMQDAAEPVNRAVLTGPAATVPGFADELGRQLHLPFRTAVVANSSDADPARITVAAGLAVEERPG
jgi:type IV pilus assembly protein PilM